MKSKTYTEDNYNIIETITLSDEYKMVMEFSLPTDHKVFCFLEFKQVFKEGKGYQRQKRLRFRSYADYTED
jgi:hypothetical protein